MKILKGILFSLLGLLGLLSIFMILCAANPKLAAGVAGALRAMNGESTAKEEGGFLLAGRDAPLLLPDALREQTEEEAKNTSESDYIPPEREALTVPPEVSGKNGYEPIQEEIQQIGETEAGQIREQASYGETGDGLDFDTEFYPYYGMLDDSLKKLYRQIYANAEGAIAVFAPVEEVTQPQYRKAFLAVFCDHPELFWLDCIYEVKALLNGTIVEAKLYFNQTAKDLSASQTAFDHAAESILSKGRNAGSDYQKEVYIHNALLDKIEYNLKAPLNQNAYSALVNGQTVCAGYARAFQYLMQQLQIPCYYCIGYAGESHAWNVIQLNGEYYNVDTTWDDTDPNTFDFFNKTDGEFAGTHRREELSVYLPVCNGEAYGNLETNPVPNKKSILEDPYLDPALNQTLDQESSYGGNPGELRSLEELGFSEYDVLNNMGDYYMDCFNHIMQSGGSTQFSSVINNLDMWYTCADAYSGNGFQEGYGNRVVEELGADFCEVSVSAEELSGGRILLQHNVTVGFE